MNNDKLNLALLRFLALSEENSDQKLVRLIKEAESYMREIISHPNVHSDKSLEELLERAIYSFTDISDHHFENIVEANKTIARFQDYARAGSDWILDLNPDLTIKGLSERFTSIVGYPASLYLQQPLTELIHAGFFLEDIQDIERAIATRKPFLQMPLRFSKGEERSTTFLSAVPVFKRSDGEYQGYRCVARINYRRPKALDEVSKPNGSVVAEKLEKCLSTIEKILERHIPEDEWTPSHNSLPLGISRSDYDILESATKTARQLQHSQSPQNKIFTILEWIHDILRSIRPVSKKIGEIVTEGAGIVSDLTASKLVVKSCLSQISSILNDAKKFHEPRNDD